MNKELNRIYIKPSNTFRLYGMDLMEIIQNANERDVEGVKQVLKDNEIEYK